MKQTYRRAMELIYLACIALSGVAMVAITLIIPSGVFMRYVMNNPLQWPEPAAVIMMVMFSFIGGAAAYRANAQIAVRALLDAVPPKVRTAMEWGVYACMLLTAAFMLGYGIQLCQLTWGNTIAEFPGLSVSAHSRCCAPWACRSPTRSAWRRSWPRSTSTSRWKP
jgi:TRAP-type C4-dicarboxylate transport system permease small subunit